MTSAVVKDIATMETAEAKPHRVQKSCSIIWFQFVSPFSCADGTIRLHVLGLANRWSTQLEGGVEPPS